jgi:Protein of unknown function (DUF3302)
LSVVVCFSNRPSGSSTFRLSANSSAMSLTGSRFSSDSAPGPLHRRHPFLNYFALFLLIFVVVVLFYGIIAVHDIPAKIAESRHHPHQDAIHAAGWVSLFTLHALWPFLWIWAMAYRPERGWGISPPSPAAGAEPGATVNELEDLRRRVAELEISQRSGAR